ncbi:ubiquitin-protein ligase peroxin 12, partial [Perkinsus olseni]
MTDLILSSLYPTVGGQSSRPSYMELAGVADLSAGVWPSVKFVMAVLMDRHPHLQRWLKHWPSALTLVLALLEYTSITEHRASMSEHFFGLCRESVDLRKLEGASAMDKLKVDRLREEGRVLAGKQKALSVLLLSLLPQLLDKSQGRGSERQWVDIMRRGYVAADAAYRIGYLLGMSPYWSPFMHLIGVRLVRRTGEEAPQGMGLRHLLWGLVYAIQFGHWYMSVRSSLRSKALEGRPQVSVPPPARPRPASAKCGGVGLPVDKRVCPVCRKRRNNPAVSAVSGYDIESGSRAEMGVIRPLYCPNISMPYSKWEALTSWVDTFTDKLCVPFLGKNNDRTCIVPRDDATRDDLRLPHKWKVIYWLKYTGTVAIAFSLTLAAVVVDDMHHIKKDSMTFTGLPGQVGEKIITIPSSTGGWSTFRFDP